MKRINQEWPGDLHQCYSLGLLRRIALLSLEQLSVFRMGLHLLANKFWENHDQQISTLTVKNEGRSVLLYIDKAIFRIDLYILIIDVWDLPCVPILINQDHGNVRRPPKKHITPWISYSLTATFFRPWLADLSEGSKVSSCPKPMNWTGLSENYVPSAQWLIIIYPTWWIFQIHLYPDTPPKKYIW